MSNATKTQAITKPNYDWSDIQTGAIFTNRNGKKTITIGKRASWPDGRGYNHTGFTVWSIDENGYEDCVNMTRAIIEHRYPVKPEGLRFTVSMENLTQDQKDSIVALLGKSAIVTRTA
jgi:hypothetical protein